MSDLTDDVQGSFLSTTERTVVFRQPKGSRQRIDEDIQLYRKRLLQIKENKEALYKQFLKSKFLGSKDQQFDIIFPVVGEDLTHLATRPGNGIRHIVLPGNKKFVVGDQIPLPPQGAGKGEGKQGGDGEAEEGEHHSLSKEDLLELIFDGLELPNLDEKATESFIENYKISGITSNGPDASRNLLATAKNAISRRLGTSSKPTEEQQQRLTEIISELEVLEKIRPQNSERRSQILALQNERKEIKKTLRKGPFIDEMDLRYVNHQVELTPIARAVIFFKMDISGSMMLEEKILAKLFMYLQLEFTRQHYDEEQIEIVYIVHHTSAKEVDEENFFSTTETGGTKVSSAFQLMDYIQRERYDPKIWNIYSSYVSDGENWGDDNQALFDAVSLILPQTNFFSYLSVALNFNQDVLVSVYEQATEGASHKFGCGHARTPDEVVNSFRDIYTITS